MTLIRPPAQPGRRILHPGLRNPDLVMLRLVCLAFLPAWILARSATGSLRPSGGQTAS